MLPGELHRHIAPPPVPRSMGLPPATGGIDVEPKAGAKAPPSPRAGPGESLMMLPVRARDAWGDPPKSPRKPPISNPRSGSSSPQASMTTCVGWMRRGSAGTQPRDD